ncbi:MAG: DUF2778 domain-containing protein [Proteobacteria bacterium]|nr:DUF2778 domain-containing protein [Pseudomonadota bacterium]
MTWTYKQSTGQIMLNNKAIGTGYSGIGQGKNNPILQSFRNLGPIPQGRYKIGPLYHSHKTGPFVMNLIPINHNALGRSSFEIHDDNPTHNVSNGCIILSRDLRLRIGMDKDKILEVVK